MADCSIGYTYLLHLSEPMSGNQHYVGWAKDLDFRIESHVTFGERHRCVFTWEARNRGIEMWVARIWSSPIDLEKWIKKARNHKKFCPICNPEATRNVPGDLLNLTSPMPGIFLTT